MKAIALLSGGLDSTLSIRVVLEQGIEVEAVNFFTPFCQCNRKGGCGCEAKKAADRMGVTLKVFNLSTEYIEMLKSPRHGYGKNLNPCIDCRILMHKKTREYMKKSGASFIITGEVLGQRPMSQHKKALREIERESGLEGLVLRPLSAKLLPLSIPEKEGWVKRERLLDIRGRSRKPQIALARSYQIGDYPCPAGGCLLTDRGFARRMKDLLTHGEVTLNDIELLKVGRHFRLSPTCKVVVGRNEKENERLLKLAGKDDTCFEPFEVMGPTAVGRGGFDQPLLSLASRIMARYCDHLQGEKVKIAVEDSQGEKIFITANDLSDSELKAFRI